MREKTEATVLGPIFSRLILGFADFYPAKFFILTGGLWLATFVLCGSLLTSC